MTVLASTTVPNVTCDPSQVEDKWPERWASEAVEQRASGEWTNAARDQADVIIVGEVRFAGCLQHSRQSSASPLSATVICARQARR